jgi:hypothetical protein
MHRGIHAPFLAQTHSVLRVISDPWSARAHTPFFPELQNKRVHALRKIPPRVSLRLLNSKSGGKSQEKSGILKGLFWRFFPTAFFPEHISKHHTTYGVD